MVPSSPPRPCIAIKAISNSASNSWFTAWPCTSIAKASAPAASNACNTASPLRNETVRSLESPPINTAILPSAATFILQPLQAMLLVFWLNLVRCHQHHPHLVTAVSHLAVKFVLMALLKTHLWQYV